MTTTAVVTTEVRIEERNRLDLVVSELVIEDADGLQNANGILNAIISIGKQGVKFWERNIRNAKQTYDGLRDDRDEFLKPLAKLREKVESKMAAFEDSQKVAAEAHDKRLKALAGKAKAEAAAEVARLMKQGRVEEAKIVQRTLETMPMPIAPRITVKLDGTARTTDYQVEILDLKELLKAIVAGEVPMEGLVAGHVVSLIEVRESVVVAYRKKLGESFSWPGVRVKEISSFRPTGKG